MQHLTSALLRLAAGPQRAPLLLVRAFATKQRTGKAALELKELRLIGDQGSMLGVMAPGEALSIAAERKLELVEVQAGAEPPVWKLIAAAVREPAAAQQQQQAQQQSAAAPRKEKPAKAPKEKEVRLTDSIAPRDTEHKIATALKFLEKGHVVKVLVLNQGRVDKTDRKKALAVSLVESVCKACEHAAKVGDVQGATGLRRDGETTITKQILGAVFATLTPIEGAFRRPATPRQAKTKGRRRQAQQQQGEDGDGAG